MRLVAEATSSSLLVPVVPIEVPAVRLRVPVLVIFAVVLLADSVMLPRVEVRATFPVPAFIASFPRTILPVLAV